jgi:hypothetical protein
LRFPGCAGGLLVLLFLSFEFFGATERYETDFAGVFLLAALAAWFALSTGAPGRRRKAVRVLGAVFALWGCLTGVAIALTPDPAHPGTWRTLENATSPISTAMATLAGHPILGRVYAPETTSATSLTSIGAGVVSFSLYVHRGAQLTIVSPDRRQAAIVATVEPGPALGRGAELSMLIYNTSPAPNEYPIAAPHEYPIASNGRVRVPIELNRGLNRLFLAAVATATNPPNPAVAKSDRLLIVHSLTIAGPY